MIAIIRNTYIIYKIYTFTHYAYSIEVYYDSKATKSKVIS